MSEQDAPAPLIVPTADLLVLGPPNAGEIVYGFERGLLDAAGVVAAALDAYERGVPLSKPHEELALLLSDDLDRVEDLVNGMSLLDEPTELRARFWQYASLAWLLSHLDATDDPQETIDALYAYFDYPEEMSGIVSFMPPPAGEEASPQALHRRWEQLVEENRERYEAERRRGDR